MYSGFPTGHRQKKTFFPLFFQDKISFFKAIIFPSNSKLQNYLISTSSIKKALHELSSFENVTQRFRVGRVFVAVTDLSGVYPVINVALSTSPAFNPR